MPRKKRSPNQYIAEGAGPYRYKVEAPTVTRPSDIIEQYEMEDMLRKCNYASAKTLATRLHREGMGPEELRQRLRIKYGAPGSIRYTHNARKHGDVS